jgi:small subunit ribosomal protein S3
MGQKTSPTGFRTGITLGWDSTWFAPKANYGEFLVEDHKIREYADKKFNQTPPFAAVSKVEIARTRNEVKVTLHTARPGIVIGPRGAEVDKLREEMEELINRKVSVNVIEIKEPALDARLVGENIAAQLKKRAAFRRVMKMACESAMNAGAKGVRIICSGRLGGAEIARSEKQKLGSVPLQTLDANVDYALSESHTTFGKIGIKVWIYKGKFGEEIVPQQRSERRGRGERGERKPRSEGRGGGRGGAGGGGGRGRGRSQAAAAPKPQAAPEVVAEKAPETTE